MTNTKVALAEIIDQAIEDANVSANVRPAYSGRGMYGDTCFGIDFDGGLSDAFVFFAGLARLVASSSLDVDEELATDLAAGASYDSMGMGVVIYFPRWKLDGVSAYADSDDEDY